MCRTWHLCDLSCKKIHTHTHKHKTQNTKTKPNTTNGTVLRKYVSRHAKQPSLHPKALNQGWPASASLHPFYYLPYRRVLEETLRELLREGGSMGCDVVLKLLDDQVQRSHHLLLLLTTTTTTTWGGPRQEKPS